MLNFLRVLGAINLALTIYRIAAFQFQWRDGNHSELEQCIISKDQQLVSMLKILCMIYNTPRSFKILIGIRSFFTVVLLIKKIRNTKNCYGFWFISTVAELCIKIYLIQNGGMDPPGLIQFCIELTMVCLLTTLVFGKPDKRRRIMKFSVLPV